MKWTTKNTALLLHWLEAKPCLADIKKTGAAVTQLYSGLV